MQPYNAILLRYVPDAVKNEAVNFGVMLIGQDGFADVRFTRDWARVRCLDPNADIELLSAFEADIRAKLNRSPEDHARHRQADAASLQRRANLRSHALPHRLA